MSGASLQDHNVEELGLSGRCVAAGLAAVVSSVLVNPLEVVKVPALAMCYHGTQPLVDRSNRKFRVRIYYSDS
jgi:hypothetical protein